MDLSLNPWLYAFAVNISNPLFVGMKHSSVSPTLLESESTFASWLSDRHLECLQLHSTFVHARVAPRQPMLHRAAFLLWPAFCLFGYCCLSFHLDVAQLLSVLCARGEPDKGREKGVDACVAHSKPLASSLYLDCTHIWKLQTTEGALPGLWFTVRWRMTYFCVVMLTERIIAKKGFLSPQWFM